MSDLYRDFIDQKADQIINSLGGTITPAPANAELYRDFLDRKFDDVINALGYPVRIYSYKGNGSSTFEITLPYKWNAILSIQGMGSSNNYVSLSDHIINGFTPYLRNKFFNPSIGNAASYFNYVITETTDYKLKYTATNAGLAFNELDHDYTIVYI